MSKEYNTQLAERKLERATKKLNELKEALNVAQQKSSEVSWAQELSTLAPQAAQINEKLQRRKKWGLIPKILIPFLIIIGTCILMEGSVIALIIIDAFVITMLEMLVDAIITTPSWNDNDILLREKEARLRVPDALREKNPSQLKEIRKRYDTEWSRIREQMREYEALINNVKTYLKSVNDYEELLEKIGALENPPYVQSLLRSMQAKIDSLASMQFNFAEKEVLRTQLQEEWNNYLSESVTIQKLPTHEDLIYKPAQNVYERPISLQLLNKGNQDLK